MTLPSSICLNQSSIFVRTFEVDLNRISLLVTSFIDVEGDIGHAFYLGLELAGAQIAYQLGKEYEQDEELKWGCLVDHEIDDKLTFKQTGSTYKKKR